MASVGFHELLLESCSGVISVTLTSSMSIISYGPIYGEGSLADVPLLTFSSCTSSKQRGVNITVVVFLTAFFFAVLGFF